MEGHRNQELRDALDEAGINKDRLLVTHAYACTPPALTKDKFERAAVAACRPLVQHTIKDLLLSTPVMVAGKWALLSLTGSEKHLFNTRGFIDMKWVVTDSKEVTNEKETKQEREVADPDAPEGL